MSGEREIRDTADALSKRDLRHTEILPLYARLSNSEQNRVFQAHRRASHRAGDQRGGNLADRAGH
jgi:HrpA-like RNA helicase